MDSASGRHTPDVPVDGFRRLSATHVSDALDRLGLLGAPHGIRPLWPGCPKIAGYAMTMRLIVEGPASPVTGTLRAIAAARPGDILVIDHGGRTDANSWGGIATFTAVRRGLAGVIIDGVTRDIDEIETLAFPAYARGIIQQSVRGRCAFAGYGIEVRLGPAAVRPGDLVMADGNGVVVIPQGRVAEVLRIAEACAAAEEAVKRMIAEGMDPVEAHERVRYDQMTAPEA